jgi:hypothetical protein
MSRLHDDLRFSTFKRDSQKQPWMRSGVKANKRIGGERFHCHSDCANFCDRFLMKTSDLE